MYRLVSACLAIFLSSGAVAQQTAPVERLANELGMPQLLAASKQRGADSAKEQINIALSQLSKSGLPEEFVAEMRTVVLNRNVNGKCSSLFTGAN